MYSPLPNLPWEMFSKGTLMLQLPVYRRCCHKDTLPWHCLHSWASPALCSCERGKAGRHAPCNHTVQNLHGSARAGGSGRVGVRAAYCVGEVLPGCLSFCLSTYSHGSFDNKQDPCPSHMTQSKPWELLIKQTATESNITLQVFSKSITHGWLSRQPLLQKHSPRTPLAAQPSPLERAAFELCGKLPLHMSYLMGTLHRCEQCSKTLGLSCSVSHIGCSLFPFLRGWGPKCPFLQWGKILILNWEISSQRHHRELGQLKSSHHAFNWSTSSSHAAYSEAQMPAAHSIVYCMLGHSWGHLTEMNKKQKYHWFSCISNLSSYMRVQSNPTHSHQVPASSKTCITCIPSIVSQCWQWRWKWQWDGDWPPSPFWGFSLSQPLPWLWGSVDCPLPNPLSVSFLCPRASLKEPLLWWNLSDSIKGVSQDYVSKTPLFPMLYCFARKYFQRKRNKQPLCNEMK